MLKALPSDIKKKDGIMRDYDFYNSCDNCQASGCTFAVPGILGALLTAVIGLLVGASIAGTIIENKVAFVNSHRPDGEKCRICEWKRYGENAIMKKDNYVRKEVRFYE